MSERGQFPGLTSLNGNYMTEVTYAQLGLTGMKAHCMVGSTLHVFRIKFSPLELIAKHLKIYLNHLKRIILFKKKFYLLYFECCRVEFTYFHGPDTDPKQTREIV